MFSNILTLASVAIALLGQADANKDIYSTTANGAGIVAGVPSYSKGFNARFFDYPQADLIRFFDDNWVANDYALQIPRTSTNGVTEPAFDFDNNFHGQHIYSMYNINMYNVMLELQGYFVAPETGLYNVRIGDVNDGAFIWLGNGAFDGCSQQLVPNSYDDVLIALRGAGSHSSYVYLEEGTLYPMRTTYINIYFGSKFDFEIITPSGDIINNFEDTIINFDKDQLEVCISQHYGDQIVKTSTNVQYDAKYSSGSTNYQQSVVNGQTYLIENLYVNEPQSTITTTLVNTFATTSTMTAFSNVNGVQTPVVVVIDQSSAPVEQLPTTNAKAVTVTNTGKTIPQATGCSLNDNLMKKYPGFHATLYKYDGGFGFLEPTYYANEYTTEVTLGTAKSITAPNFSVHAFLGVTDTIYGEKLDSWKGYVAQLTGYIYAQETGLYEFSMDYSDDGSMVWIGTNDAFACCEPDNIPIDSKNSALFFEHCQEQTKGYVHLVEGNYYPIRVVLVNWYGDSVLEMSMITPSGAYVKEDWSNWIVSVDDHQDGFCQA